MTFILLCIIFIYVTFNSIPVNAEDTFETCINDNAESIYFEGNSPYQSYQYYEPDGTLTTITILSNTKSLSGEKTITYSHPHLNMSFKIYISDNKITGAYGATYSSNLYTILSSVLTIDSNTQATHTLTCVSITTFHKYLRVNINSGQLVITHN